MPEASLKQLKAFFDRPLTGKPWRFCAVILKLCLAASAFVILVEIVAYYLNPQIHWLVFVAHGCPDPPKDYSGTWRIWMYNGQLLSEESYSYGKRDGLSMHWDTEGRRQFEISHRAGQMNGSWISFHDNGSVCERVEYTNGIPTGHRIKFYENGTTNFEVFHSKPGARDGPEVSWTKAGERKILRVWRDGEPWDGRFWSVSNGDRILRVYDNGRFISETNMGRGRPPAYRRGAPSVQQVVP